MKEVSIEQWHKMLDHNCNKGKHRIRMNRYGVAWCCICGLLSNTNNAELMDENDALLIKKD